jgi:hypothetical protein
LRASRPNWPQRTRQKRPRNRLYTMTSTLDLVILWLHCGTLSFASLEGLLRCTTVYIIEPKDRHFPGVPRSVLFDCVFLFLSRRPHFTLPTSVTSCLLTHCSIAFGVFALHVLSLSTDAALCCALSKFTFSL